MGVRWCGTSRSGQNELLQPTARNPHSPPRQQHGLRGEWRLQGRRRWPPARGATRGEEAAPTQQGENDKPQAGQCTKDTAREHVITLNTTKHTHADTGRRDPLPHLTSTPAGPHPFQPTQPSTNRTTLDANLEKGVGLQGAWRLQGRRRWPRYLTRHHGSPAGPACAATPPPPPPKSGPSCWPTSSCTPRRRRPEAAYSGSRDPPPSPPLNDTGSGRRTNKSSTHRPQRCWE